MKRSRIRPISKKKAARKTSAEGRADAAHLDAIRALPCAACGRAGPSEAHHCRDRPDYHERHLYDRLPGAGQRSADRDAIPLCSNHHRMFHLLREEFHAQYGRDYYMIAQARDDVAT